MDRSWIRKNRSSLEYVQGVNQFIEFAIAHGAIIDGLLRCPCRKCNNLIFQTLHDSLDHMICIGFIKEYSQWHYHGEPLRGATTFQQQHDEQDHRNDLRMVHEAYGYHEQPAGADEVDEEGCEMDSTMTGDAGDFHRLVQDAQTELYPGCTEFSKLEFLIILYNIKCLNSWSDNSFKELLKVLKKAFPKDNSIPKNFNQMKKIINAMGCSYEKIDACRNDCMLFWKDNKEKDSCEKCGASRWKNTRDNGLKTPAKILRYFPLKRRLQRLFMSSKVAPHMRWHDEKRIKDGLMRHPADSPAWKDFDEKNPEFASDPRNVRLGLSSDGFNPFRTMSISHSTWPVVVFPYNLPPWMCMKQPNMILSLLIPGPRSPGNDIDVYLRPLIDELKELWDCGVPTYDADKKETFQMRAALLWTISDFPAYAMLSGWSTKGALACPTCNKDTCSYFLKRGRKQCYMGHRRFLPTNHRFRRDKKYFDGKTEFRGPPIPLSGYDIVNQLEGCRFTLGKNLTPTLSKKRGREQCNNLPYNWKKLSIFFELPYWKHNLLRHNLDVMHIEKNVCDNVIGTLFNIDGKSKDNFNARLDLMEMKLRPELHPKSVVGMNKTI